MISTEAQKFIKISAFISHAITNLQVVTIDKMFELTQQIFHDIKREDFDFILILHNEYLAITKIHNSYICKYDTSGFKGTPKTKDEILSIINL